MKKFKNKSLIIGLASVLGVASLAATSCSTTSQKANTNPTEIDRPNPFQAVNRHTVTFVAPTPALTGFHYEGRTTLDVKDGYPFGILPAPTPVCAGYALDHWEFTENPGVPVEKTTRIDDDYHVVPVMVKVTSDITISSTAEEPHNLYDGLYQAKVYSVTSTEALDPTQLTLQAFEEDGETESDAVTITQETGTTSYSVIANDTLDAQTCILKATYGTGASAKTAEFKINVYPPYYYAEEEEIEGETYDYGKCYWVHRPAGMAGGYIWQAITEETVCDPEVSFTAITHNPSSGEGVVSEVSRYDIVNWEDLFPGCEINAIGDDFMAYSGLKETKLHGGVDAITKEPKVIASIGDRFLQDCIDYNQNINDVFTVGAEYSITIGDCFMDGCISFANGGVDFVLPTAVIYGDYFMNDCRALEGEIELHSQTVQIGSNFMNGTGISAVTIPSTFGGETMEDDGIGAYFLTECDNLKNVTILTEDVSYFKELSMPAQDRGSFVRFLPYDDPTTGITLLCPNAADQFLEGFPALEIEDEEAGFGYYRLFTLDTETHIASWDYMTGMYDSPYEQHAETQFTSWSQANQAYYNAIQETPEILLADMLTKDENMHNGSTIDNVTITLSKLDFSNPEDPTATYRIKFSQSRDLSGMLTMTQECDLEFANIPFGIMPTETMGVAFCNLGSPLIVDPNETGGSWGDVSTRLASNTNWSIKGRATIIINPLSPEVEPYAINKVWTNLNLNSTNFSSSDFLIYDHPLCRNPYGMFALMGVRSDYLLNCSVLNS